MEPDPKTPRSAADGLRALAQPVAAPLSRAAIFLVVTVKPGSENRAVVRSFCADLSAIIRAVEMRDLEAGLSCIMGVGSGAWDRLFGAPRPAMLHPFREIRGEKHTAVATPGDLLFHIRAKRMDLCFELETQIMTALGDAIAPALILHSEVYRTKAWYLPYVYGNLHARHEWESYRPLNVGETVRTRCTVIDRYFKRDREYVVNEALTFNSAGALISRARAHDWYLLYADEHPRQFARFDAAQREHVRAVVAEVSARPPSTWAGS